MTDYHYKGNYVKVVGLKDEYSLEVEELHIKNSDLTNNSKKVSFSKIMVSGFSQLKVAYKQFWYYLSTWLKGTW